MAREFCCLNCGEVTLPTTTPCAHNFCKSCLEGAFTGKSLVRDRNRGGRALRTQKNITSCPSCPTDIFDFLQNPQVNRELMDVIESLKLQNVEEENGDSAEEMSEDEYCSDNEISTEMVEEAGIKGYADYSPTKSNPERCPKLQKVDSGLGSPRTDDAEEVNEIPVTQTNGKGSVETNGEEVNEIPVMLTDERSLLAPVAICREQDADQGGVAANTSGRKNDLEVVGEDNGSPSSPLFVQSDLE